LQVFVKLQIDVSLFPFHPSGIEGTEFGGDLPRLGGADGKHAKAGQQRGVDGNGAAEVGHTGRDSHQVVLRGETVDESCGEDNGVRFEQETARLRRTSQMSRPHGTAKSRLANGG